MKTFVRYSTYFARMSANFGVVLQVVVAIGKRRAALEQIERDLCRIAGVGLDEAADRAGQSDTDSRPSDLAPARRVSAIASTSASRGFSGSAPSSLSVASSMKPA